MQNYPHLTKSQKIIFWKDHIHNWKSGNMTKKKYCSVNGLNIHTFGYHIAGKKKAQQSKNDLVPVRIDQSIDPEFSYPSLELCLGSTITLKIPPGFKTDHLIEVLELLRTTL